ncbi:hypothetical protein Huta_2072 [Halorhabdus utahensis DSM 12940]|uniref:Uncharacterized protein n=1 Tax=Halorhabdus utahensis (strain DSM 12940 / JCM 11049 / AX-2) TaxID=519442 RepID=C7NTZ4_HALUD|nr:hypothetical protein [Halorhabdus utahensis]ACV12239.1 hypothetical protein Huta_2072 [Halorhabdus utahensis DSM 12940]
MSVLGDAVQALNEDIEIAAFLPGVNYVFLLIASEDGSNLFFGLALGASVVGATLFNHLRHLASDESTNTDDTEADERENASEEWEDPRDGGNNQSGGDRQISQQSASMLLLLVWGALLLVSMHFLFERFSKNRVLPEVLFFISVGFIALYVTDIILNRYISSYNS